MKTTFLLLSFFFTSMCIGQAIISETIPTTGGSNSSYRAPNGSTSHTSFRAHYIISASELSALPNGINISTVAFNLIRGTNDTANGNFKFYMENTSATTNTKSNIWDTAIAGMDTVYDGIFTIPNTPNATQAPITLSQSFNYTGGGIFIAYEYIGSSFGTVNAVYDCNTSITSGLKMIKNSTTTPGLTLTSSSSYRPILTVNYLNPFSNDIAVDSLSFELGHPNKLFDTNQTVSGIVRNKSNVSLSSIPITLTITGANPSVSTQTIASIPAGGSHHVSFNNLSTALSGNQAVKLSVPSDQFTSNDSIELVQTVSCVTLSYLSNTPSYTSVGFNTGSGILAAKHKGSATINTHVKSIFLNIGVNTNITGNQIQAVMLDSGGNIVDSSAIITITSSQLGTKLIFPLTGNNLITPSQPDFFVGIRQYSNTTTGYFPLSTYLPSEVPTGRYYVFNMDGTGQTAPFTTLGTMGIGALIEAEKITLTNSDANDSICGAENITFTASGTSSALYEFKSGGVSLQNTSSNTYTSNVNTTTSIYAEGMYNNCPLLSDTSTINLILVNANASKTDDSTATASISGASYQWIDCGTNNAVTGANSQTFVASVSGNYKVVVTQNGCSDTSICYSLDVPLGSSGINENKIESLKIYPSPTHSILNIETDYIQIKSMTIKNIDGKILDTYSPNNRKAKIDVSHLPSGIYLIQINSENKNEIKRFIKQ